MYAPLFFTQHVPRRSARSGAVTKEVTIMNIYQIISQLEDLKRDHEAFLATNDTECSETYKRDITALDAAIKILRTKLDEEDFYGD